jgi:hypothetical protein
MHDQHHRAEPEFSQRFVNHLALDRRSGICQPLARAPAMARAIDQDHPMFLGEPLTERLAHDFKI